MCAALYPTAFYPTAVNGKMLGRVHPGQDGVIQFCRSTEGAQELALVQAVDEAKLQLA